jgi:transposase InsO family protein
VKKIRSDNGSEFKNLQVEEYLGDEGVKHEFSAPYTPQQNGVVEWKNRTLIDMARMMLGEFKTSYELLTGNKPNVSYFRVFGMLHFGEER